MSSPLAVVSHAPQMKALFAKFDRINDPLISAFTASIPERFADAVSQIESRRAIASDFVLNNRVALASFVRKFHVEAGTLTAAVESMISLLDDPTAQIVV